MKGLDYLIDITIFYAGFIGLSLFWLHERTRDYNNLLKKIEWQENSNQKLEQELTAINTDF